MKYEEMLPRALSAQVQELCLYILEILSPHLLEFPIETD